MSKSKLHNAVHSFAKRFFPDVHNLPKHNGAKNALFFVALFGFFSLARSQVSANGVTINTSLNNSVMTIDTLRVLKSDGTWKVVLNDHGIQLDLGTALGVLKRDAQGYITQGLVGGSDIGNGVITSSHIANNSITSNHIANGAITNIKIQNNSITCDKLNIPGFSCSGVVAPNNSCPTGQYLIGINNNGSPNCAILTGSGTGGPELPHCTEAGQVPVFEEGAWRCKNINGEDGDQLWERGFGANKNNIYNKNREIGNVGVGLTNPSANLHVKGTFLVEGQGNFATCREGTRGFPAVDCPTGYSCYFTTNYTAMDQANSGICIPGGTQVAGEVCYINDRDPRGEQGSCSDGYTCYITESYVETYGGGGKGYCVEGGNGGGKLQQAEAVLQLLGGSEGAVATQKIKDADMDTEGGLNRQTRIKAAAAATEAAGEGERCGGGRGGRTMCAEGFVCRNDNAPGIDPSTYDGIGTCVKGAVYALKEITLNEGGLYGYDNIQKCDCDQDSNYAECFERNVALDRNDELYFPNFYEDYSNLPAPLGFGVGGHAYIDNGWKEVGFEHDKKDPYFEGQDVGEYCYDFVQPTQPNGGSFNGNGRDNSEHWIYQKMTASGPQNGGNNSCGYTYTSKGSIEHEEFTAVMEQRKEKYGNEMSQCSCDTNEVGAQCGKSFVDSQNIQGCYDVNRPGPTEKRPVYYNIYANQGAADCNGNNGPNSCIEGTVVDSLAPVDPNTILYVGPSAVGIYTKNPQYALDVVGAVRATQVLTLSDARLKSNIKPVTQALEKLMGINGYIYTLKVDGSTQYGLLAQQVEEFFPYAVTTAENGYKAVNYNSMIAPMIESLHELNDKVNTLEKTYQNNEARIKAIEAKLAK